jgi:glycosyltransferase involved in cell wall biosynthesis
VRVSATLIVRDESRFIDDCLASLSGMVDEIILVDTGSRDDTIERTRRYPVALHSYAWHGDFSAARNFAIGQATGDWILYIDADERLELPDPESLRRAIQDDSRAAWRLRLFPRIGWTAYAELRLFRNDPRIRFQGVIHEGVHAAVEAVCHSDGLDVGICDVALRHVGYEGDQLHKVSRNVSLLRDYLRDNPDRSYCWWHLGEMLQMSGDDAGAIEAWQRAMVATRAEYLIDPGQSCSLAFVSLIELLYRRGEPVDDLLREALDLFPDNLLLQWNWAKLALERFDHETARPVLERLAAIDPQTLFDPMNSYDMALFTYLAPEALALCHLRAGRFQDAAMWYRRAALAAPDREACEVKARLAEARAAQV